jgi:hypothetical protein
MNDTDVEQAADTGADDRHDGPITEDTENPWHGIPHELLDAGRSYDPDTAGGCG